jgi:hypothetical protein
MYNGVRNSKFPRCSHPSKKPEVLFPSPFFKEKVPEGRMRFELCRRDVAFRERVAVFNSEQ